MANIYRYKSIVLMWRQTAFGTAVTNFASPVLTAPVKCVITPVNEAIENPNKTGTIAPMNFSRIRGRGYVNVSIEGAFSTAYSEFWRALTGDTSSAYVIQDSTARDSYTIHNWRSATQADKVTDCVLKSFSITGESNGVVMFKAEFLGKAYTDNLTITGLTNYPTIAATDYDDLPFLFGNITVTTLCDASISYGTMYSFELTVENEFVKEDHQFLNNLALQGLPIIATTGTFKFSTIYDTGSTLLAEDHLNDQDVTEGKSVFALASGATSHTITLYGQVIEEEKPDPDRGLIECSFTVQLAGDSGGTHPALSVTVA